MFDDCSHCGFVHRVSFDSEVLTILSVGWLSD